MLSLWFLSIISVGVFSAPTVNKCKPDDIPSPIVNLPNLKQMPSFNMWSGYLKAGTDNKNLFYWLNEAQERNSTKLIIWIGGKLGFSSMYGLFKEHGPFMYDDDKQQLLPNDFSWNRFAHTLYIDTPINTGFSYNSDSSSNNEMRSRTQETEELQMALEHFFQCLHPSFQGFDIYFGGETEAAKQISELALRIMEVDEISVLKSQFKGILLGNPNLSTRLVRESHVIFARNHGLIRWETYDNYVKHNCNDPAMMMTNECQSAQNEMFLNMFHDGLSMFNVQKRCEPQGLMRDFNIDLQTRFDYQYRCLPINPLQVYLNRNDVKRAIHAEDRHWNLLSAHVYETHEREKMEIIDDIMKILREYKKPMLLYYGQQSILYNEAAGGLFLEQVLTEEDLKSSTTPYVTDPGIESVWGITYENMFLQYVVIENAGQMAAHDKPEEVFTVVRKFVQEPSS